MSHLKPQLLKREALREAFKILSEAPDKPEWAGPYIKKLNLKEDVQAAVDFVCAAISRHNHYQKSLMKSLGFDEVGK